MLEDFRGRLQQSLVGFVLHDPHRGRHCVLAPDLALQLFLKVAFERGGRTTTFVLLMWDGCVYHWCSWLLLVFVLLLGGALPCHDGDDEADDEDDEREKVLVDWEPVTLQLLDIG